MKINRNMKRFLSLLSVPIQMFMLISAPVLAAENGNGQDTLAGSEYNEKSAAWAYEVIDTKDDTLDEQLRAVTEIYEKTGVYLAGLKPGTGQIGGEWLVIGLARSEIGISKENKEAYLAELRKHVRENCNNENRLSTNKSTENSRVILALSSLLYNTGYFEGRDLLAGLSDMNYVKKQGINGSIWALIAFDSNDYEISLLRGEGIQTTREGLIAEILSGQLADGGFALAGETANADITGMALQALAPYYEKREDVRLAVDKALSCLSGLQLAGGGYASWGEENMESNAQVLAALSSLGIDCRTDVRFVKNGNTVLDAILGFALEEGTFAHSAGGSEMDLMATEQAYYALTAYYRLVEEKNSLYDMSDLEEMVQMGDANGDGLIDAKDALVILKADVGLAQEAFIRKAGDCDGIEGIDAKDALIVLKYDVGVVEEFSVRTGK